MFVTEVWGKVIFSEACVKNSIHGGWPSSMHYRWYPSIPCRYPGGGIPACLAGLQAHNQGGSSGVWPGGSPGPHLGGLQAHTHGVIPACTEADKPPPPQKATAAGGTHPTGMHSCFLYYLATLVH